MICEWEMKCECNFWIGHSIPLWNIQVSIHINCTLHMSSCTISFFRITGLLFKTSNMLEKEQLQSIHLKTILQISHAIFQAKKIWSTVSTELEQIGHNKDETSTPFWAKFHLDGKRSREACHTKIFSFLVTNWFHLVGKATSRSETLSMNFLVCLNINTFIPSKDHHHLYSLIWKPNMTNQKKEIVKLPLLHTSS